MGRYTNIKQIRSIETPIFKDNTPMYKNVSYPEVDLNENDIYIETDSGDRLDLLAEQFYGKAEYYWVIQVANPNKVDFGSLFVEPGLQLGVPLNINDIISQFNKINNL